jgi:hypothetical protein
MDEQQARTVIAEALKGVRPTVTMSREAPGGALVVEGRPVHVELFRAAA